MQARIGMAGHTQERILDRYRPLEELAMGGTARVLRARDEQLDRDVAVKLLHPHLLPDETSRRRLAAEARAAAGLSHPGVVAVYDIDTDPAAPALVMELVDGDPLSALLARHGPMPPREVARLGAEVADALYHAHRRGIVHRDVKPGNILVERATGRARLVDFGIAHSLAASSEALTQTGTTLGTPRYMAPEQLAGGEVGPRADLFSLGAVLHEALTGSPPFAGRSPLAIAREQQAGPPPVEGVDPGLANLVRACLAVDPADRPVHAAAVAGALRAWAGGDAGATTLAVAPVPPAAAAAARPAGAARPTRSGRRPRWLPAVTGVALALALIAAAVALPGLTDTTAQGPTPSPTVSPTPDPLVPLLAAYEEACGEPLARDELAGMEPAQAAEHVEAAIAECREEARDDDDDDGRGNGGDGGGNDDDKGNGGGNGNGRGRGNDGND